jgi:hypothetical protein
MKYKILLSIAVLCTIAIVVDSSQKAYSNAAGAPAGCSGSPSDGTTCANSGCHTGSNVTKITGWISSNIPAAGYTPGKTYQMTAKAVYIGRSKFGFEVSPQDLAGNIMGRLTPINGSTQVRTPGYITHTTSGNTGTDSIVWTFNWTAPAYGSGGFIFYGAFNCANGNAAVTGDLIYTSGLAVKEAPSPGVDAGILGISSPHLYSCSGSLTPVVNIHNFGLTTLSSATINYYTDANTPSTFSWSGSLATDSSQLVTLPAMTITNGHHTFTAATSNPNSVTDTIPVNDGHTVGFDSKLLTQATPFFEGFDTTLFPKVGWEINNPDNDTTWRRSTKAFHSAPASAFINNYLYNKPGRKDEIISPTFNLASLTTPVLTFQVAYQMYTDPTASPNASDTLVIAISTDCGATWNQLYKKFGVGLATATPVFSTTAFVPKSTEWRFESINLASYTSSNDAMFKFVNITDYENNLYLDDIKVDNSLGIENVEASNLSLALYPNPATDRLMLNYEFTEASPVSVKIYDMKGREILSLNEGIKASGKHNSSLDLKDLQSGMYMLRFTAGAVSETRRFAVSH